jgi:hypothetical protein
VLEEAVPRAVVEGAAAVESPTLAVSLASPR